MKFFRTVPFIIAVIIFVFLYNQDSVNTTSDKIDSISLNDEAPINQKERFEWEYLRLRDPKTGEIPKHIFSQSMKYAQNLPGSYSSRVWKNEHIQSNEWTLRGPINIGGRTRALALDVLDENIILAGGVSGGMWRSTDFGKTWTKTTKPNHLQSTSCIAQDIRQGKENVWYVGTGEYFNIYGGLRGDGIYKSTDAGLNWNALESTISNTPQTWDKGFDYVWNIVTDHTDLENDVIYAATAVGAIQKSTDGGETWQMILGGFGNDYSWFTDIAISPTGVLYAALSQKTFAEEASSKVMGIYRSEDGEVWTDITPDFIPQKFRRVVIGISPSDENQVYFLAETPDAGKMTTNSRGDSLWHSIWKYTYIADDGTGENGLWEDRTQGIPAPERVRSQFNSQGSYDLVISVKPDNPEVVIIGGTNLYRSTDGFRTEENVTHIGGYCWDDTSCYEIYTYTNHHADEHAITFLPSNPDVMLTGTDGGVAVTHDVLAPHVDWESLNWGYYTTQFYTCAIDHAIEGNPEIIGGLQDNGTLYSYDSDINTGWANAAGADGFHCAISDSGTTHYTSNNTSKQPKIKVWRRILDNEGNILTKTRIDPIGALDMIWNTPFKLDPNNTRRMYLAGGNILWRNNNLDSIPIEERKDSTAIAWDSLTYTACNQDLENMGRAERISALDISINPANIVYYGTTYGRVFRIDNAHEGDPEPVEITSSSFPQFSNIGCLAIDPNDANKVFVVFTNFNVISIFYSTDAGENWEGVAGNLEQYPSGAGVGPAVYSLEVLAVEDKNIYLVGTSTGLYSTAYLDGMKTVWQMEGAETLGNVMVYQIDSRHSDGFVAAASFGLGMFTSNITSLPVAPQPPQLTYPANDTTGILEDVLFEWEPNSNHGNYHLQIAVDENFENISYDVDGLTTTSYKVVNLEQGLKKFYWRVIARGFGGLSEPSETRVIETAIDSPELLLPEDNTNDMELPITLNWSELEEAESYHILVSENIIFTKIIIDTVLSSNELIIDSLQSEKRYYWKVSSIHEGQEGLYSKYFRFKTIKIVGIEDYRDNMEFKILRLYPNPGLTLSRINFSLSLPANMEYKILDINGRIYSSKLLGRYSNGEHIVEIQTSNLPAGNYILRLKADKYILNKKITILK